MRKSSCKIYLLTNLACSLGIALRAQNAAPVATQTNASPLLITATPDATTVHPGDTVKFDVTIKNVGTSEQTVDVPNIVWAAVTDVPQIVIPGWPRNGGIGPAVTFRSVTIVPGAAFKRSWTANVLPTAEPGEVTLRVGVPLHRTAGDKTWSGPEKMQIVAKEPAVAVANPLYAAWKGQEGKTVTFNRTESMSGGAPVSGLGSRVLPAKTVQFTLAEFTADQGIIKFVTDTNQPADTLIIPAKLMPDDPTLPKPAGTEELKIGGKTYACTKYTYFTSSKVELGREPYGLRGRVTVWVADGVPGGVVQRNILLTIRVSYNITDTLADGQ